MMQARLPLVDALTTTAEQCDEVALQEILFAVIQSVEGGESLADSLRKHPDVFESLYVHMVAVGEEAGILDDVLMQLAEFLERRTALRRTVRLAFVYPGLILSVAIAATAFLLTVIVPTFADVFTSFDAELPAVTKFVLEISNLLQEEFLWIGAGLVGVVFAGRALVRTPAGRRFKDVCTLRAPLFGSLATHAITARFCRTLGTLLNNGVGLVRALEIQRSAATNVFVVASLDAMLQGVERGYGLTASFEDSRVFPPFVVKMIEAGEKSAELDSMLMRAAKHYESHVEATTETLTSILEPILIVVIGGMIGGILIAIYMPMFDMVNVVQ